MPASPPSAASAPFPPGPFPAAPRLQTERLLLRPLTAADAPAVFAYASQPGFFTYLDHVPPEERRAYRPEHAGRHVAHLQALAAVGWPHWGLVPRASADGATGEGAALPMDGAPVGAIRFHHADDAGSLAELGYALHPAWWGRGLATEAARAVLAWAQGVGVQRAVARCHPANAASARVLEKAGFTPGGTDPRGRLSFCWTGGKPSSAGTGHRGP